MVGFRLMPKELAQIEAHRRDDELFSECVRRLLLERTATPPTPPSRIVPEDPPLPEGRDWEQESTETFGPLQP